MVIPIGITKRIEQAVLEFDPDIIHVQGHFTVSKHVIASARKKNKNIPIVGTNHFMPENLIHYLHLPSALEKKVMAYSWSDFRKTFDTLHTVTAPTESASVLATGHGFSQEIQAISCGIDLALFNPDKKDSAILKKYHLPAKPILLYVGRLDKEKNVDVVLRAVAAVPKTTNFHLAVAGKGQEQNKLKKLAEKLGIQNRVTFLGFVPNEDLPALYATSDCFVIACEAELQCIVAMEAMASGLPIIAVDALALPELAHDNENGFLFPPKDTVYLAQKIETLFTDATLRTRMGAKSLDLIRRHNIETTISSFETIYTNAITQKSHEKLD